MLPEINKKYRQELNDNTFGKHRNTEISSLSKFNDFKFIANKFPMTNYINNINKAKNFNYITCFFS